MTQLDIHVLYLCCCRQERKSEHIMNLFLSEETTNFKATSIVLAFVLMIELADGTGSCQNAAVDDIISPLFEPSV